MKKTNLHHILRFNCERNAGGSFSCNISQCLPDLNQLTPFVQSICKVDVHKLSLEEWGALR